MHLPGAPSLLFLFYIVAFLPWLAIRSARRLRQIESSGQPAPPRQAIWTGTILSQAVLLILAWLVGRGFRYRIFAVPPFETRHLLAALAALALCFVLRWISRIVRSPEERRRMAVYRWAPRTEQEWVLWTAAVLLAAVAEEAAYRGVGLSILWYALGSPWPAVLISSSAFALAHWTQGWKSAATIFCVALVMHALVALTGTLVFAMIVHAVYDFIAGYSISRTAREHDRSAALAQ